MDSLISELIVANVNENLFSDDSIKYVIPLYQRAFAWEDTEITQLIEDIKDFEEDTYYLGSLIVSRKDATYEVIDGQQRLTALFLLLSHNIFDLDVKSILTFACREKSNYTLKNINNLLLDKSIEPSLQNGRKIIDTIINGRDFDIVKFKAKLAKVKLYRIEVPQNTDLNRYFEIMNTRGEQLEQHDILKATLMSVLNGNEKEELFAKIWDACSDMTGYVQMHFGASTKKGEGLRERLFGDRWWSLQEIKFDEKIHGDAEGEKFFIRNIIDDKFKVASDDGVTDKDERIRFESIITFPFLLLHTLKVFVAYKNIGVKADGKPLLSELLDDKKLIEAFNKVITNGVIADKEIGGNLEDFSLEFIKCLLKCRFLFDKYIIKREYINENSDGEWSLKELQTSDRKAYYVNTIFKRKGGHEKTDAQKERLALREKANLMLQSCLRVSYTSPKVMHWITTLLKWLYTDCNLDRLDNYEYEIEDIAIAAVESDFLLGRDYNLGVKTPHIVFNYLDYLLWWENQVDYKDFVFEFRNSIEHWYPQHPSEGTFEPWSHDDGVDNFGNLCIIQRNVNSKFSNMSPTAKKTTFDEMIAKGSLKLRIMAAATGNDAAASKNWRESGYIEHEKQMIEKLKSACGISAE